MKKILINFWSFAAIILAVTIFFYPVWLKNQVPIPGDFVLGTYYPWLDYKWPGFPAGVPVKNPITTDVVSFIYPMRIYAVELLKQGVAPLWNPLILSGTPLLANFQSAPFSPTNIFYFFFSKLDSWSLQIIFQPILAAIFLYLLLREMARSKLASTAGGLFFAFAGFSMIWMEWNAHSLVAAFFPLIILLSIKWLRTGKVIWGVFLSISLALQIFSGYPQIILYEVLALLGLFITLNPKSLGIKKIIGFVIFLSLGIALAAIQILPGLELLKFSQRKIEDVINVSAFLPIQMIITIVTPDFFGNHVTKNYWGPGDYTLVTGYSGVVTAILASLGLLKSFGQKYAKFGLFLILLSLAIAFENPISVWARDSGFLGLQAASAHRALVLLNLGFAILASFGIDHLKENKLRLKDILRSLYLPGILVLSFSSAVLFINNFFVLPSIYDINIKVAIRNLILPFIILIFSAGLLILSTRFKKPQVFASIIILLGLLELFRFGWKFMPFTPKDLVFPKTPVIQFLQNQESPFRISGEDVIPINLMMNYGITTTEGYDAVYPLRYAKYLSTLNSGNPNSTAMGRYGSVSRVDTSLFDIANTKYVLALKRDKFDKTNPEGMILLKFQRENLKKVFEDRSVVILENIKVLPRSKMFYDFEEVNDEEMILGKLLKDSSTEKIILEKNPNIKRGVGTGKTTYMEEPNKKVINVETGREGILFIGDSWYPGWRAFVDGKNTEIIRADFAFSAVPVTSGNHKVVMEYKPVSFEIGKWVSGISLGLLLVCYYVGWRQKNA